MRIASGPTVDISITVVEASGAGGDAVGPFRHRPQRLGVGHHRDDRLGVARGLGRARRRRRPARHEVLGLLGGPVPHDHLVTGVEEPAREPGAHRPEPEHGDRGHAGHYGVERDVRHIQPVAKVTHRPCPRAQPGRAARA